MASADFGTNDTRHSRTRTVLDTQLSNPSAQRILDAVKSGKAVTRADLSRTLNLAPSTISTTVNDLIVRGLLKESSIQNLTGGRPAKVLVPTNARHIYVAIDFCTAYTQIACADATGTIIESHKLYIDLEEGPHHAFDIVIPKIREIIAESSLAISILGIAVSLQGHVSKDHGSLEQIFVLPCWSGFPVRSFLASHFNVPIYVVNSARAEAYAEHLFHPDFKHSITVRISTCIGTGLIIDSRVYEGATGIAGDLAHTTIGVRENARVCSCGNTGCLLTVASAKALAEVYGEEIGHSVTVEEFIHAVQDGERIAMGLARNAGRALGRAMGIIMNFLNPDGIFISGQLSELECYLVAVRSGLYDAGLPSATNQLQISRTRLGERGATTGAIRLLREYFQHGID